MGLIIGLWRMLTFSASMPYISTGERPKMPLTKAGNEVMKWLDAETDRTQTSLATMLGISQPQLWQYMHGVRTPKLAMRRRIQDVTGVQVEEWQ